MAAPVVDGDVPEFCQLPSIQKTREGCGCPKFLAGKVFWQISTLLENASPIFRQHEMLSLPRFGHFLARKTATGKLAAPSGRCWIFSSETAAAFLSSSDQWHTMCFFRHCQSTLHEHSSQTHSLQCPRRWGKQGQVQATSC